MFLFGSVTGNCLDTNHQTQEDQKVVVGTGNMTTLQKQMQDQEQQQSPVMKLKSTAGMMSFKDSPDSDDKEEEEMTRSALAAFKAKEDEIEKKKMEVRDRVYAQLDRAEEAAKQLAVIREVSLKLQNPNFLLQVEHTQFVDLLKFQLLGFKS